MKKKIILIIITLCFIVTGCKTADEYFEECEEFAIQKLKEKYGEEFEYDSTVPNQICYSTFCSPAKFYMKTTNPNSPLYNKKIYVRIENAKEENKILYDDYVAIKYEEKVQEMVESLAKKYFTNIRFFHSTNLSLSDDLTSKTTLEEYMLDDSTMVRGLIEIKESDFDSTKINQFFEDWFDKIADTYFLLIVSKNENFGNYSEDYLREIKVKRDYSEMFAYGEISKYNGEKKINIYRDNVVARKYDNQLKEYLNKVVTKYFPNAIFNIYRNNQEEVYDLDLNITFDDYLRDGNVLVYSSYGIKEKDYSKGLLDNIINEFQKVGLEFCLDFYILDDEYAEGTDMSEYSYIRVRKNFNEDVTYEMNDSQ